MTEIRIRLPDLPQESYRVLTLAEVESMRALNMRYVASGREFLPIEMSIPPDDAAAIELLQSLWQPQGPIWAYWASDAEGVECSWATVMTYFEDFWRPSRDDTFLLDRASSKCLIISHEETLDWFDARV